MPIKAGPQDVVWIQASTESLTADLSQTATSRPRQISNYRSYSFNSTWSGSPKGRLTVEVCNADTDRSQLVGEPHWVTVDNISLELGQGNQPATNPSSQGEANNSHLWVRLVWTPSPNSTGTAKSFFGGVIA